MTEIVRTGLPVYQMDYVNERLVSTTKPSLGISAKYFFENPDAQRRPKPKPGNLIWAGTAYSKSRTVYTYVGCVYKMGTYGDGGFSKAMSLRFTTSCDFFGFAAPKLPPEPVDPMNRLINSFRGDVANIATMLGEYKESAHLFEGTSKKILKAISYAHAGKWLEALGALGQAVPHRTRRKKVGNRWITESEIDIPSCWLLFKLALSPLIGDIDKIVAELTGKLDALPAAPSVRKTAGARTFIHDDKTISAERYVLWSGDVTRQLVAYATIDNHQLKSMSDHGLTSPLGLMWELTWLSFVVDYVFNVSEWLQALDMPMNFTRSVCYETRKVRINGEFRALGRLGLGSNEYPVVAMSPVTAHCKHEVTTRNVRPLQAVSPQWNPRGSTARLATLSSLAVVLGRKLLI